MTKKVKPTHIKLIKYSGYSTKCDGCYNYDDQIDEGDEIIFFKADNHIYRMHKKCFKHALDIYNRLKDEFLSLEKDMKEFVTAHEDEFSLDTL